MQQPEMTSKQRVRAVFEGRTPDRAPAAFEAVTPVWEKMMARLGAKTEDELREKLGVDIYPAAPRYAGPPLPVRRDAEGRLVTTSWWGFESTWYDTTQDRYEVTTRFPFDGVKTAEQAAACRFPDPGWFDYTAVAETCRRHPDKAIILGHEGPFQMMTFLMPMEQFLMLMIDEPDAAQLLLDRMVDFELEYYRRSLEAAGGGVDILRVHDDYGTQISLLFSVEMWRRFFAENTRRLVRLAHRFGAFYQQHSCGAVGPIVPELLACGVDSLEPLQKVAGLEPEALARLYKGRLVFHGGVDTQRLLPFGRPDEVAAETARLLRTLGRGGGYILMASQGFENDVPPENIEAVYSVPRTV